LDASKVNVDLSFPKGESLAIIPPGNKLAKRQVSEKNAVRSKKLPSKTMTNKAVSKNSYKAMASPNKLTKSAEIGEDDLSDDEDVTPTDQILDDSLSLKGTPTMMNDTGESYSKKKLSHDKRRNVRMSK